MGKNIVLFMPIHPGSMTGKSDRELQKIIIRL